MLTRGRLNLAGTSQVPKFLDVEPSTKVPADSELVVTRRSRSRGPVSDECRVTEAFVKARVPRTRTASDENFKSSQAIEQRKNSDGGS